MKRERRVPDQAELLARRIRQQEQERRRERERRKKDAERRGVRKGDRPS